eukprot:TRINITY_DN46072_c0_g1_i1.p1 TRINITY_DN46072_c0_g1~~TRINITY_DN46072_c0_g1_i1.p1  ORF type:complete len:408 (+),score=135.42 TRINITY_DN46072_c0_g1_i1:30-1226(+)
MGVFDVPLSLQRYRAVANLLDDAGVERFADVGCGEGSGLTEILSMRSPVKWRGHDGAIAGTHDLRKCRLTLGVGIDKDHTQFTSLEAAKAGNPYMPLHMSLWGADLLQDDLSPLREYLACNGVDSISCVEVVEHINTEDLPAFGDALFSLIPDPRVIVVTTPNRDANLSLGMQPGTMRHHDHRFEFTEEEFRAWAEGEATKRGFDVSFSGVGRLHNAATGRPVEASLLACFVPRVRKAPLVSRVGLTGQCSLPACSAAGGCAWKGKRLRREPGPEGQAREVVFSSMSQSWLAYDVCTNLFDALRKHGARQGEWVQIGDVAAKEPIPQILEHSPDFLLEVRAADESCRKSVVAAWAAKCLLEANNEVRGLVGDGDWIKLAGCKWCGYEETCPLHDSRLG